MATVDIIESTNNWRIVKGIFWQKKKKRPNKLTISSRENPHNSDIFPFRPQSDHLISDHYKTRFSDFFSSGQSVSLSPALPAAASVLPFRPPNHWRSLVLSLGFLFLCYWFFAVRSYLSFSFKRFIVQLVSGPFIECTAYGDSLNHLYPAKSPLVMSGWNVGRNVRPFVRSFWVDFWWIGAGDVQYCVG